MPIISPKPATKLYKQEGKTGMYQSMLWALSVARARLTHVPVSWGEYFVYFKRNYLGIYWDEVNLEKVAQAVLERAPAGLPDDWQREWEAVDAELTAAAYALVDADLRSWSLAELHGAYERLFELDQRMWSQSIFIDTFDPGFDQARMETLADEYGFSDEEVQLLVSPVIPAFVTEWNAALHELEAGKLSREELYNRFFWYATDYWQFGELDDAFIAAELGKKHEDEAFVSPKNAQVQLLAAHGLTHNPFMTFQTLTTWRDIRKRLNYTGLYGLMKLLREILVRHSIDPVLANAVLPHQVPDLVAGKITEETLARQFEESVLFHVDADGGASYLFGEDAAQSWAVAEAAAAKDKTTELRGMVASRGKAVGRVCNVPHVTNQNAYLMQEGDILVTSMTRPEFVPLMRKAGAIITNEGGITSHAAIVSRELGIPCVIGTKIATQVLSTGDMVEVDADTGIVRIIASG